MIQEQRPTQYYQTESASVICQESVAVFKHQGADHTERSLCVKSRLFLMV